MPTLAEPLEFNAPPDKFMSSITSLSGPAKTLLWHGLAFNTRKGYNTPISSYVLFCAHCGIQAWSAIETILIEWITQRIYGANSPKQGQIKPNTAQSYLSALKSAHIDLGLSTQAFSSSRIDRILRGAHNLFPNIKKERLPITKDILQKITSIIPISIEEINIDAAFKVAWAGFLRMGEFTYTNSEARSSTFINTLGHHICIRQSTCYPSPQTK